jgi:hypothetical protein
MSRAPQPAAPAAGLRPALLACLLLIAAVLAVYGQTAGFDFVAWDDDLYVAKPQVEQGLSAQGARWALTALESWNWHPLTWLSLMLDVSLFGPGPAGPHATNVALHAMNALLLFAALHSLLGAPWTCAFAAALFAVHPLNTASVAHVAERKGLLAAAFGLLAIRAWAGFAQRGGAPRALAAALCLALGLMCKPVLVTLPALILVLDFWPLRRVGRGAPEASRVSLGRILVEKLPLFALAALASAATLVAQRDEIEAAAGIPLALRVANAAVACVSYLAMAIWPSGIALLHPHPYLPGSAGLPGWQVAGAALLLLALSALAVRGAARHPAALVGWLWFLILLAPVIGLVQVGAHGLAERYFYLPGIGLFLAVSCAGAAAVARLAARTRWARPAAAALALAALAALATRAWLETRYWRDSVPLFERSLEVEPAATNLHYNLAAVLADRGQLEEAALHFEEFLRVQPDHARAQHSLGLVRDWQGRPEQAIAQYQRAVELDPAAAMARRSLVRAHNDLGVALEAQGDLEGAIQHYRAAVEADPRLATPRENLRAALEARP